MVSFKTMLVLHKTHVMLIAKLYNDSNESSVTKNPRVKASLVVVDCTKFTNESNESSVMGLQKMCLH